MGRTPTSGSATLRAAKTARPSSACFAHARGATSPRYHGSTAVTSAPAATAARNRALGAVSVALA